MLHGVRQAQAVGTAMEQSKWLMSGLRKKVFSEFLLNTEFKYWPM
jgi:hypothetical protein